MAPTELSASSRQRAGRRVMDLATTLGMPEAVYIAEHGVTIIANQITGARWKAIAPNGFLPGADMVPVSIVEAVSVEAVSA